MNKEKANVWHEETKWQTYVQWNKILKFIEEFCVELYHSDIQP